MCPTPASADRHWDGSPRITHRPRALRLAATSPSRLLRAGQSVRCRWCGNRIDLHQRTDQRPLALHPAELAIADVPEACRWHLSGGIAHPHGDGSPWSRIPHSMLCPRRTPACRFGPRIEAIRRQLALHTHRMTDTGAFTPAPQSDGPPAAGIDEPRRPVVQMLLCRYLAERPLKDLRCVAQTRHRHRCPHPLLAHTGPAGTWRLLPAQAQHGQLALLDTLMAVYDLGLLPHAEQRRWRTQRCVAHAAITTAADLAVTTWQPFDPLLHAAHIHTRLPHPAAGRHQRG